MRRSGGTPRAVFPGKARPPHDDHRPFGVLEDLRERMRAVGDLERLRPGAEIIAAGSQSACGPITPTLKPLATQRLRKRALMIGALARVGADQRYRVRILDAGDGR